MRGLARALAVACVLSLSAASAATAEPGDVERITLGIGGAEPNSGAHSLDIQSGITPSMQAVFATDASNYIGSPEPDPPDVDVIGAVLGPGGFQQWSLANNETQPNSLFGVFNPSINASGTRVAFDSDAINLLAPAADGNGAVTDVFMRDESGSDDNTVIVSLTNDSQPADGASENPSVSGTGDVVAFEADATNLVASADTNSVRDIYQRDVDSGFTTRISMSNSGVLEPNGTSINPSQAISNPDVAYQSDAANLTSAPDTNDATDVFVGDGSGTTLISVGSAEEEDSYRPSISDDGSAVAFLSEAQLTPGGAADSIGAYMRTWRGLPAATTERADLTYDGSPSEGAAWQPYVVGWPLDGPETVDARWVAFSSYEDSLVPNDTNDVRDVFLRDLEEDRTIRVSVRGDGGQTERDSAYGVFTYGNETGAPEYVAFSSKDDDMVEGEPFNNDEAGADAFVIEPEWERPDTSIASPATGAATSSQPVFAFESSESASTFQCNLDGGDYVPCQASATPAPLPAGTHTLTARAVDRFGNYDDTPASTTFTVQSAQQQPQPPPPPQYQSTFNAEEVEGEVFVTLPNGQRVPIDGLTSIPEGSIVDTTNGTVRLYAEERNGEVVSCLFFDGVFRVTQLRSNITQVALVGPLRNASASAAAVARVAAAAGGPAAQAARKRRRVWGNGKGRFRSKGKYSSATIRGTRWLVEDRPGATLTVVKQGTVSVRDFAKRKTVVVKKGKRYLARKKVSKKARKNKRR